MNFKRVLVTGGAGFIGSHIVEKLVERGISPVVLDDLSTGKRENIPEGVQFVEGSVLDQNLVNSLLHKVDGVIHLAARVGIRDSVRNFVDDARVNLMGTLSVIEAMIRAEVKKIIYASSMAVYGNQTSRVCREEDHPVPISPYGVSKLASEYYCIELGKTFGFDAVCLRFFNTYGPRQTFTPYVGVITIFINHFLRGESPTIFGNGEQVRDYIYVRDVAEASLLALEKEIHSEVINIGSGHGTSVNQIASLLQERLGKGIKPLHGPEQPGEVKDSIAGTDKAGKLLGFTAKERLEDRIEEVIEWNKTTPSR
jgi:UDP-glucose 4-epimerase